MLAGIGALARADRASYASMRPCTADEYALQQFAQWDRSGDGLISAAEVEKSIAAVLDLPDLSDFPPLRASVLRQYRALDTSPPTGLDVDEFAAAAWVQCGLNCRCSDEPPLDGVPVPAANETLPVAGDATSGARRLQGVSLPGETNVPGVWEDVAELRGDLAVTVQQMTLFNSNQMRTSVKVWAEEQFGALASRLEELSDELLESVICGGQGKCSDVQRLIIDGFGGMFGAFLDLGTAFVARLTIYVVPSFSLVQTFQTKGAFAMDVPSVELPVVGELPLPPEPTGEQELDLIALLHVVPGEDVTINRFLARMARLPLHPAVAFAHFSQDGGFDLDFSLATVITSPGSIGQGKPVLDVALQLQLTSIATAYEEVFEFDDANANGIFDEGETVGRRFKLAELGWRPVTHTTSDGSCMTETDLSLLELGTLQALCIARGLPLCSGPSVDHAELVSYLESNPVGCTVDVAKPVILVVESRTQFINEFPDFSFAVQVGAGPGAARACALSLRRVSSAAAH
jgi:hypothetical protein